MNLSRTSRFSPVWSGVRPLLAGLVCLSVGCTDGEVQAGIQQTSTGGAGDPATLDAAGGASDASDSTPPEHEKPASKLKVLAPSIDHVLLISIDGLASRFLRQLLDEQRVQALADLGERAAYTHNARTDKTYTNTLPNHTSMVTGLPVTPPPGTDERQAHGWVGNTDPAPGATLHNSGNPARTYTPSVFDVAHDHGLSTAMFASKTKFSLYSASYNEAGAPDEVDEDDGPRKIDTVEINLDFVAMTDALIAKLQSDPPNFTFVHFNQPDGVGHGTTWGSDDYLAAVVTVDGQLQRILDAIQDESTLMGRTAVIVTTDHGGVDYSHLDPANYLNFVIPFYVFAPGVPGGRDLYSLVEAYRVAPEDEVNPGFEEPDQPIRNGDSGNLALELLRLPAIPGSLMHPFGLARTARAGSASLD